MFYAYAEPELEGKFAVIRRNAAGQREGNTVDQMSRYFGGAENRYYHVDPEIRPEFDGHTSNAGTLQSGMPHLARFQEFHRLSTHRHVFFCDNQEA
jgi:hypothetical protein